MVDLAGSARSLYRYLLWCSVIPEIILGLFFESCSIVHLSSGTDQAVAVEELITEPGNLPPFVDRIEPEGDLCQFDRDGVEIHAIGVVVGNVHAYPLQFTGILIVWNSSVQLSLFSGNIRLRELIDRLVEEGGGAHCWLTDGEV